MFASIYFNMSLISDDRKMVNTIMLFVPLKLGLQSTTSGLMITVPRPHVGSKCFLIEESDTGRESSQQLNKHVVVTVPTSSAELNYKPASAGTGAFAAI